MNKVRALLQWDPEAGGGGLLPHTPYLSTYGLAPILPVTLSRHSFKARCECVVGNTKRNVLGKLEKGSWDKEGNLKTVPRCFLETKKSCTHTPCFPLGPIMSVPDSGLSLFLLRERERRGEGTIPEG